MGHKIAGTVKVIIFDLGRVIVGFDHMTICKGLAAYCTMSPDEIYQKIFNSGLEAHFDEGNITGENFFKKIIIEFKLTITMNKFKKIWNHIFQLTPGISRTIKSLKKDYKLLCLSNTNEWHFEYCRNKFRILELFDDFILSYKIGKRKPASEIFQEAIMKAKCHPHECLYIDDIAEYVRTAKALGMKAIHFRSMKQLKSELKIHLRD